MDLRSRKEFGVGGNLGMNFQSYYSCPFTVTFSRLLGCDVGLLSH